MTTRKVLAAATLAALLLAAGALQPISRQAAADAAHERHAAERPSGPRWAHSLGADARTAARIARAL